MGTRNRRAWFLVALCAMIVSCHPAAPVGAPTAAIEARTTPPPTAPLATVTPRIASPTPPPSSVASSATPVPPTVAPIDTRPPAAPPSPTAIPGNAYEGWGEYRNDAYRFAFRYPLGWEIEEDQPPSTMVGHGLWVRDPALPQVGLQVGWRREGEDQRITPTGLAAGEIVTRGSVLLLGEELQRDVLVALDKDMEVLYGCTSAVRRGDIDLFLRLHCACSPTDETTLSAEAQATADQIVASFRRAGAP